MDFIESKGKTVDEAVFSGLLKMDLSIDEVDIEIVDEGGSLFKSARVRLYKKNEADLKSSIAAKEAQHPQHSEGTYKSDNVEYKPRERKMHNSSGHSNARQSGHQRREGFDRSKTKGQKEYFSFPEPDADFVPQEPDNDAEKFLLGLFERMGLGVKLKSENEDGILKINLSGRGMGMLIGRRGETLDALQYLTSLVVNSGKEEYTKVMLDTEQYRKKREDTLKRLATRLSAKVQKSGKRVVLEPMNPYERRILHATLQDDEKVYTYSEGEDPYRSVVVDLRENEPSRKTGQ